MAVATCDFETYYDDNYSLRKMSEIEYILDQRFEAFMCAIKIDREPTTVVIGSDIGPALRRIDWSCTAMCSHNTRFDGAIAAWHYGIAPCLYLDTMAMAKPTIYPQTWSASLDAVSRHLGLPNKGDEILQMKGKRLRDFTADELARAAAYCAGDNDNCYAILQRLRPLFQATELLWIDLVLRMFIQPQVWLNEDTLRAYLGDVRVEKAAALAKVSHIDPSVFSSNQQFAALLESYGVDVPTKVSPTTGHEIPALAKNDYAFKELCSDPEQPMEVQALLAARLGAKSTLEETRTERLIALAGQTWPWPARGIAPIPMRFYGAHTGRVSGDGGINWLNIKRRPVPSRVFDAIEAPAGWRCVHRDASQIEARMVAWLARCQVLLDAFADKRDIYCEFGSEIEGRTITKADTLLRQIYKVAILGLGYNMSWQEFIKYLFVATGIKITEAEAQRVVNYYRDRYQEIPVLWRNGLAVLYWLMQQSGVASIHPATARGTFIESGDYSHVIPAIDAHDNALWMPNGLPISYPELAMTGEIQDNGRTRKLIYYVGRKNQRVKIFGGKTIENVSQALSRIVVTDIAARVRQEARWCPYLHHYDSLDYCVPQSEAAAFDALLDREFARRPWWAPDLPLASEGGWGKTWAEADRKENN